MFDEGHFLLIESYIFGENFLGILGTWETAHLIHPLKHMFSVFKRHNTYFHPYIFPHMFWNNKKLVFKCMYQTPSKVIDDMFLSVPQNVKKKKKKKSKNYYFPN